MITTQGLGIEEIYFANTKKDYSWVYPTRSQKTFTPIRIILIDKLNDRCQNKDLSKTILKAKPLYDFVVSVRNGLGKNFQLLFKIEG